MFGVFHMHNTIETQTVGKAQSNPALIYDTTHRHYNEGDVVMCRHVVKMT
jgi:hypothetical protein